jgi:hypothetical protein
LYFHDATGAAKSNGFEGVFEGQENDLLAFRVIDLVHGFEPLVIDTFRFNGPLEVHDEGLLLILLSIGIEFVGLQLYEPQSLMLNLILVQLFLWMVVSHI